MEIYTDGSASPNPGFAGAGVIFVNNGEKIASLCYSGGVATNNQMELYAAILALESVVDKSESIVLYTDSEYVQRGIVERMDANKKRDWYTVKGEPIPNRDLWIKLSKLYELYTNIQIKWVKAHNGNCWNELVDKLAKKGGEKSKLL